MFEVLNSLVLLQENKVYPDRIILFRDGVGDGQLDLTKRTEVAQILESYDWLETKPKFTFCVVQKRINARIYVEVSTKQELYNEKNIIL